MSSRIEPLAGAEATPRGQDTTADRVAPAAEPGRDLTAGRALVLGAMHGPAELLPISSSGHVALVPWLLRWDYADSDPELRKAFEVVLHAGTAAALLITLRHEVEEAVRGISPELVGFIGMSFAPPAIVGYTLERQIERHLGTPATIAGGLICGSIAMAWADRSPQIRRSTEAGALDALLLGVAQACALLPGVSRNGATLAAARMRRFTREDANRLSRHVALPVIAGATLLKTVRLIRRGLPPRSALPFALGATASFASTLGSTWLIRQVERDRSLSPYAAYRLALAALVLRRLWSGVTPDQTASPPASA
ncbi:MAG TPA: undecaprenyl-diphosphate phosphatase [Solirubrobacteraceae bacterium]|jgi:undecaprenyl-diphosphatase|nr:undecaprenyl-diphosphate phosphatase [Solirubrobacteraceae bacterium]